MSKSESWMTDPVSRSRIFLACSTDSIEHGIRAERESREQDWGWPSCRDS